MRFRCAPLAHEADIENLVLHANRPEMAAAIDMGIPHLWLREKHAAAFPTMSRSIFNRAFSARSWRISICSAVNFEPRPLATSLPDLCALIQFDNVCSITPSDRAASSIGVGLPRYRYTLRLRRSFVSISERRQDLLRMPCMRIEA